MILGVHACAPVDVVFFFQAEDGIRELGRSRGLGDGYKRQVTGRVGAQLGGQQLGVVGVDVGLTDPPAHRVVAAVPGQTARDEAQASGLGQLGAEGIGQGRRIAGAIRAWLLYTSGAAAERSR